MSPNIGAGERAEAALLAYPGRRNSEIATELSVDSGTVRTVRKRLAAAGLIPAVPELPIRRAERELRADAARSDRLIASAAGVDPATVRRVRHRLQAAGEIPLAPQRASRPHTPRKPSRTDLAILAGARSTREIMIAAGVSRESAWKARLAWEAAHPDEPHAPPFRPGANWRTRGRAIEQPAPKPEPRKPPHPSQLAQITNLAQPMPDLSLGICTSEVADWWTSEDIYERRLAIQLCHMCPVREPCASWSLNLPDSDAAVYGGLMTYQRRRLKKERQRALASQVA